MGYMDQEFLETFIALLNSEPDTQRVMAKQSPPGGRRQFLSDLPQKLSGQ